MNWVLILTTAVAGVIGSLGGAVFLNSKIQQAQDAADKKIGDAHDARAKLERFFVDHIFSVARYLVPILLPSTSGTMIPSVLNSEEAKKLEGAIFAKVKANVGAGTWAALLVASGKTEPELSNWLLAEIQSAIVHDLKF